MNWNDKIDEMRGDKISVREARTELEAMLDQFDWFYDTVVESRSITVYVSHMNRDIMKTVPHYIHGFQVKLAFSGYLLCEDTYGKCNYKDLFSENMLEDVE